MIVYGWKSKNIKQAPLEGYECPSCRERNSHIVIFAYYVHIFWVPLFAYKKTAQISCLHCQYTTTDKEMLSDMEGKIKKLKSAIGIPKYMFTGLILIGLSVAYFSYMGSQNTKLEAEYMADPQTGDVYVLKDLMETTEYSYYLMKVDDVVGDSLTILFNTYIYNVAVDELDPADGFSSLAYSMHKNSVIAYDVSGELIRVIRDYSAASGFDRIIEHQELDTLSAK